MVESDRSHKLSNDTIAVAMSGGVDSSTVAAMLRAEGHNLIGLTMQLWNQRRLAGREGMPESSQGRCCSLDDVYDARRVAQQIGIPYYVVNHEERFERDVIRPFVEEYVSGRTPIPCSLCNNHLKFDQLLIVAQQIGASRVATGHYARVAFDEARSRWLLKRPADPSKDQTYFLFGLTQEQLSRTIFPLGDMTKPQVRELARQHGLALAEKPDSQEICFVPGGDYKRFIDAYLRTGRGLARHRRRAGHDQRRSSRRAFWHSQFHRRPAQGSRRGHGLAALRHPDQRRAKAGDCRWRRASLFAHPARPPREPDLGRRAARADACDGEDPTPPRAGRGRDRKNGRRRNPCDLRRAAAGDHSGQAAVFYDGHVVVGGGWIA